jgi:hypothetical protein
LLSCIMCHANVDVRSFSLDLASPLPRPRVVHGYRYSHGILVTVVMGMGTVLDPAAP